MEVLAYEYNASVTGAKDLLSKFRTFAVARGWTSVDYQTSKVWASIGGGHYGWTAGNHDYLELYSAGYGSQDLHIRIRNNYVDATNTTWISGCITPGAVTDMHDTTSPEVTHSFLASSTISDALSLPTAATFSCWFFGNAHCLWVVIQFTATTFTNFMYGSPTFATEYQTTTEGFIHLPARSNSTALWSTIAPANADATWHGGFNYPPGGVTSWANFWWKAAAAGSEEYAVSLTIPALPASGFTGGFNIATGQVVHNTFCDLRTIVEPTFWVRNVAGTWEPAGSLQAGHIVFAGLNPGDIFTYGTEQYIAFPNRHLPNKYGYVFRIA